MSIKYTEPPQGRSSSQELSIIGRPIIPLYSPPQSSFPDEKQGGFMVYEDGGNMEYEDVGFMEYEE